MRNWITLLENVNVITVYHGDNRNDPPLHRKMFFSSDEEFATNYGKHVTAYRLDITNFADSHDAELIKQLLPLYDAYDSTDITTIDEYMTHSADTWEMIENRADDIIKQTGSTGIIVYEGGVRNFLVYDLSVIKHAVPLTESERGMVDEVAALMNEAEKRGIKLRLATGRSTIYINTLKRTMADAAPHDIMRELCALADRYRAKLSAYSSDKEMRFYQHYDFESIDASDAHDLIRVPH